MGDDSPVDPEELKTAMAVEFTAYTGADQQDTHGSLVRLVSSLHGAISTGVGQPPLVLAENFTIDQKTDAWWNRSSLMQISIL